MNLQNPSTLYSAGQGIFDSTPYRVAYERSQQQKAAKREALDKYFAELPKTLNDAGVRDIDRPVIDQKVLGLKQFYLQNKDEIRKGGAARYNYEKMIRDASNGIGTSKNAGKDALVRGKAWYDPNQRHLFDDNETMEKMRKADLPIDHPEYTPFDYSQPQPLKPFDVDKNRKVLGLDTRFKPDETTPLVENDPTNPLYDIVTQKHKYSDAKLDALRSESLSKFDNDRSFNAFIKKQRENPEIEAEWKNKFREVFKEELKDDYDAAAMYQYTQLQPPVQKVKRVIDTNAAIDKRFRNAQALLREREANINARAKKYGGNPEDYGNALDEFGIGTGLEGNVTGVTTTNGFFFNTDGSPKNGEVVVPLQNLPGNVLTSLQAGKLLMTSGGFIIEPSVTLTVKDGQVQSLRTKQGIVSRQSMENLQKKANVEPIKAPQPQYGNKSTNKKVSSQPVKKTGTFVFPKGKTTF